MLIIIFLQSKTYTINLILIDVNTFLSTCKSVKYKIYHKCYLKVKQLQKVVNKQGFK